MGLRRIHIPQLIILGAFLLGACADKEGEFFEQVAQERNKIDFNVYTVGTKSGTGSGAKTRVDLDIYIDSTHFKVGRKIGVFGFYHNNSTWKDMDSLQKPNFMFDVPVEKVSADTTAKWSYSPLRYWPNETGATAVTDDKGNTIYTTESEGIDRLSFFGYYPYSETGDGKYYGINFKISDTTHVGLMGEWEFTQRQKAAENVDFMMSELVPNLTKQSVNGQVNLKFHHMLSQLWCTYKLSDSLAKNDGAWLTIDSIRLEGIHNHGYLFPEYTEVEMEGKKDSITLFNWKVDSTSYLNFVAKDLEHLDSLDALSRILLVVPQEIPEDAQTRCWYTIHFPPDEDNPDGYAFSNNYVAYHLRGHKDKDGNEIDSWDMSKRYRYLVTVGLYEIKFTCEVIDWTDRTFDIIEIE